MKRLIVIAFAIGMTTMSSTAMAAMSKSKVRKEARFLTDKMGYELDLSIGQRNDTYEINYDFIYSVRDLMDDVLRGDEWAMDRYYYLLDMRNDDLRWVLSDYQYRRFIALDYFYRPIYASGDRWSFRIYFTYTNHNHFFFGRPDHYTSYHYDHFRHDYEQASYYRNRYNHTVYVRTPRTSTRQVYDTHRRADFSTVTIRPNTSTRPNTSSPSPRQSTSTARRPAATSSSSSSSSDRGNSSSSSSSSARSNSSVRSNSSSSSSTPARSSSARSSSSGSSTRSSGTTTRGSGR